MQRRVFDSQGSEGGKGPHLAGLAEAIRLCIEPLLICVQRRLAITFHCRCRVRRCAAALHAAAAGRVAGRLLGISCFGNILRRAVHAIFAPRRGLHARRIRAKGGAAVGVGCGGGGMRCDAAVVIGAARPAALPLQGLLRQVGLDLHAG